MPDSKPPTSPEPITASEPESLHLGSIEDQVDELLDQSSRILEEARAVADEETTIAKSVEDETAASANTQSDAPVEKSVVDQADEQAAAQAVGNDDPIEEAPVAVQESTNVATPNSVQESVKIEEVDELIAQAAGEAIEKEETDVVGVAPVESVAAPSPAPTASPAPAQATKPAPADKGASAKPDESAAPKAEKKPAASKKASAESRLAEIAQSAQAIAKRIEALPFMPLLSRLVRKLLATVNSPWETLSPTLRTLLLTMAAANAFVAVSACFIAFWRIL